MILIDAANTIAGITKITRFSKIKYKFNIIQSVPQKHLTYILLGRTGFYFPKNFRKSKFVRYFYVKHKAVKKEAIKKILVLHLK